MHVSQNRPRRNSRSQASPGYPRSPLPGWLRGQRHRLESAKCADNGYAKSIFPAPTCFLPSKFKAFVSCGFRPINVSAVTHTQYAELRIRNAWLLTIFHNQPVKGGCGHEVPRPAFVRPPRNRRPRSRLSSLRTRLQCAASLCLRYNRFIFLRFIVVSCITTGRTARR